MKLTIISSLCNCDRYINNYIETLKNLKNLENNKLIIWNVYDCNEDNTNKIISDFCEGKDYIKLILIEKKNDKGLYDSWNQMIKQVDTELVCNYNADDKLHPDFIIDYIKEFELNPDIDIISSYLKVTKNLDADFTSDLLVMFDKKKIFIKNEDDFKLIDNHIHEPDFYNSQYKENLIKASLINNSSLKTTWVTYDKADIYDFFLINKTNFIDIPNTELFYFLGCAPMLRIKLFKKFGNFNEDEYSQLADYELWMRFCLNGAQIKILQKPYVIYLKNPFSYGRHYVSDGNYLNVKKKLMINYNPILNYIRNFNKTTELEKINSSLFLKIINDFCDIYTKWGKEEIDLVYKFLIKVIKLKKSYNNEKTLEIKPENINPNMKKSLVDSKIIYTIIEKIINYNLIYFYENKQNFEIKENMILHDNILFFEGKHVNGKLIEGKLYDIVSRYFINNKDILIYDGMFINGLISGFGTTYNLSENASCLISGMWLNGYIFEKCEKKDLNQYFENYTILNLDDLDDYNLYRDYVYEDLYKDLYKDKNKFNRLHMKKLNPFNEFILDNYELVNFYSSENDEKMKVIEKNKKIFYYDNNWQYPVITEKRIFDIYKDLEKFPENYFAFPWATLIDQICCRRKTNLMSIIYDYKINVENCFTVCQHIGFRRILPLLKKIGITYLFASHCTHNDYLLEKKYGIKIYPFPLFPLNSNNNLNTNIKKKYLCSFAGSYFPNHYINDVRKRLLELSKYEDCYIQLNDNWHYMDIVYKVQIYNQNQEKEQILEKMKTNEEFFSELLKNSVFSLCPNGTGPNTIRLWESLSYGSIPVILSNQHKLPDLINWEEICIIYDDKDITGLYLYLKSIPESKITHMQNKCIEVYNKYFSKENFNKVIEYYL